jgi:uncharacterized glyoxalase superfamily protein PhnB
MIAVANASRASRWYQSALGATVLWDLGSVVGLAIEGAAFFLGEPTNNRWESPDKIGTTSVRVEVFTDDPDAFIQRATDAGANAHDPVRDHAMPWGTHRQGGFIDPFGHVWLVGDRTPLQRH